jgi:response regulator NasT
MNTLRIVIADDEPHIAELYKRLLARQGHHITVAHNGVELLDACRLVQPDLVITDVRMPLLSGIEAVQELLRERSFHVILASASDVQGDALDRYPFIYLRKPVGFQKLQEAIDQLVGKSSH